MEKKRHAKFSRREFLRTAAVAGLGLAAQVSLPGCRKKDAAPVADEPANIRFVSNHGESNVPLFEKVLENFAAAYPHIEVEYLDIAGGDFYNSINAQGAAGDLPDIWYTRTFDVPVYASKGWTVNLQPLIDRDAEEVDVDDFWPAEVAQMQWEGDLYALPYDFSNMGIFYNKALFDAEGKDYPPDDWNMKDLMDLAVQFVQKDDSGAITRWGMTFGFGLWTFWGKLAGWGGNVITEDFKTCIADSAENRACLEFFAEAREKGAYPESGAMPAGVNPFAGELVPLYYNGSWATVQMRSLVEDKFVFDVAALPVSPSGKSCISAAGGAWGIAANSKFVEQTWVFNKFLTNTESTNILISEPVRSIPGRKSSVPAWKEAASGGGMPPENVEVFADQNETALAVSFPPYWQDMNQAWSNIVVPYLNGTADEDAGTVLKDFQEEVTRIIDLGW